MILDILAYEARSFSVYDMCPWLQWPDVRRRPLGYEPSELTTALHCDIGATYPSRTGIFTKGWFSRPVGDHSPLRGMASLLGNDPSHIGLQPTALPFELKREIGSPTQLRSGVARLSAESSTIEV